MRWPRAFSLPFSYGFWKFLKFHHWQHQNFNLEHSLLLDIYHLFSIYMSWAPHLWRKMILINEIGWFLCKLSSICETVSVLRSIKLDIAQRGRFFFLHSFAIILNFIKTIPNTQKKTQFIKNLQNSFLLPSSRRGFFRQT